MQAYQIPNSDHFFIGSSSTWRLYQRQNDLGIEIDLYIGPNNQWFHYDVRLVHVRLSPTLASLTAEYNCLGPNLTMYTSWQTAPLPAYLETTGLGYRTLPNAVRHDEFNIAFGPHIFGHCLFYAVESRMTLQPYTVQQLQLVFPNARLPHPGLQLDTIPFPLFYKKHRRISDDLHVPILNAPRMLVSFVRFGPHVQLWRMAYR